MGDRLPAMLTVEEAGGLLRIGRTKAYAMAREWRETGGRSGLPVVDLGHVLRVPRRALEELIGAELTGPDPVPLTRDAGQLSPTGPPPERSANARPSPVAPARAENTRNERPNDKPRNQKRRTNQLDLLEAPRPKN